MKMKKLLATLIILGSMTSGAITKAECDIVEQTLTTVAYLTGFAVGKAMDKTLSKEQSKEVIQTMKNANNGIDFMKESPRFDQLTKGLKELGCK
jgi:hypothetical protein